MGWKVQLLPPILCQLCMSDMSAAAAAAAEIRFPRCDRLPRNCAAPFAKGLLLNEVHNGHISRLCSAHEMTV